VFFCFYLAHTVNEKLAPSLEVITYSVDVKGLGIKTKPFVVKVSLKTTMKIHSSCNWNDEY